MVEEMVVEEMVEPVRMSYLEFLFQALGFRYSVLLPAVALLAFVLVLFLIIRGKGPALTGALLFLVPLPVLVGVFAAVDATLQFFMVMTHFEWTPRELAKGISAPLVSVYVGFLLAILSYILATCGLIARAFSARPDGEPPLSNSPLPAKVV